MLWCVQLVNVMSSDELLSWKPPEGKSDTQIQTHTIVNIWGFCVVAMLMVCHQHTQNRYRTTATHQCFYWWCTEEYLTTRSEPTCFCHHQLLLFVMVTHSHSISMHTPNAYSLLQITHPRIIAFALGLLILHHRYEQHILKETWQWLHPWVPQCAWTWLSETTHLTKYHIWMILRIHGCINDIKCEKVRRAWTQSKFLEVQKGFWLCFNSF